jgi:hypothetical protein
MDRMEKMCSSGWKCVFLAAENMFVFLSEEKMFCFQHRNVLSRDGKKTFFSCEGVEMIFPVWSRSSFQAGILICYSNQDGNVISRMENSYPIEIFSRHRKYSDFKKECYQKSDHSVWKGQHFSSVGNFPQ